MGREGFFEEVREGVRMSNATILGGEPFVRRPLRMANRSGKRVPPFFAFRDEQEPAFIRRLVSIHQRVGGMLAINLGVESSTVEGGLYPHRRRPHSLRHQGGGDMTSLPCLLSAIETGQDRRVERRRSGLVAEPRHRQGGRTTSTPPRLPQSGSCPIPCDVKARFGHVRTAVSIACNPRAHHPPTPPCHPSISPLHPRPPHPRE